MQYPVFKEQKTPFFVNRKRFNRSFMKNVNSFFTIQLLIRVTAWQRPTLPAPCGASTIGAGGLNGRVRHGNGCVPSAIITRLL